MKILVNSPSDVATAVSGHSIVAQTDVTLEGGKHKIMSYTYMGR